MALIIFCWKQKKESITQKKLKASSLKNQPETKESEICEMEEVIDVMKIIASALGYKIFNKIKTEIRDDLGKFLFSETECKPMIITIINEI